MSHFTLRKQAIEKANKAQLEKLLVLAKLEQELIELKLEALKEEKSI